MTMIFKKLIVLLGCSAFFIPVFSQEDPAAAIQVIVEHRKKQEEEMRSSTSPLLPKDKKKFKGLKYYPVNLDYRVKARFVKTQNPVLFKMKTTKDYRNPDYVKYGEVHFALKGEQHLLEVYQSPDITRREGYEDYLFIPFTDATNGQETYEVGRYIEMRIPDSDEVILDFNLCYNPYCCYSPNYACPIPPAVNHLPIPIEAGEKKFKKHK